MLRSARGGATNGANLKSNVVHNSKSWSLRVLGLRLGLGPLVYCRPRGLTEALGGRALRHQNPNYGRGPSGSLTGSFFASAINFGGVDDFLWTVAHSREPKLGRSRHGMLRKLYRVTHNMFVCIDLEIDSTGTYWNVEGAQCQICNPPTAPAVCFEHV